MKLYYTFLIALLCSMTVLGQTTYKYNYKQGYKFILKAEKNLKRNNLAKAELFIAKAKASNYGFCGNAWASAHSRINLIETQMFNKQQRYDEALVALDSLWGCGFGADCRARDSLKVVTLFLKFGKEKVKTAFGKINAIHKSAEEVTALDYVTDYWVIIDDLHYTFRFDAGFHVALIMDGKIIAPPKTGNEFYDLVKDQPFYQLLE